MKTLKLFQKMSIKLLMAGLLILLMAQEGMAISPQIAIFNSSITNQLNQHNNVTDSLDVGGYYSNTISHVAQVKVIEEWANAYGISFVELNESQIESGVLLSSGLPTYPIIIIPYVSVASSSTETALLNYMNVGGNVLNFGLLGKYDTDVLDTTPHENEMLNLSNVTASALYNPEIGQIFNATSSTISVISLTSIYRTGSPPPLIINLTTTQLVNGWYYPTDTVLKSITVPYKVFSDSSTYSPQTSVMMEFNVTGLTPGTTYAIVFNGNSTGVANSGNRYMLQTVKSGALTYTQGNMSYNNSGTWTKLLSTQTNSFFGVFNGTVRSTPLLFAQTGITLNDNLNLSNSGFYLNPYYGFQFATKGADIRGNISVINTTSALTSDILAQNSSNFKRVGHFYNLTSANTVLALNLTSSYSNAYGLNSTEMLPLIIETNYGSGRFIEVPIVREFATVNEVDNSLLFHQILKNSINSSFNRLDIPFIYKSWYPIGYSSAFVGMRVDSDSYSAPNIDSILINTTSRGYRLYFYAGASLSSASYNQTLLNIQNNGSVVGMHYDTTHQGPDEIGNTTWDGNWTHFWTYIDAVTGGNYSTGGYTKKTFVSPSFHAMKYNSAKNISDKMTYTGETNIIPYPHRFISDDFYYNASNEDLHTNLSLIEYPVTTYINNSLSILALDTTVYTQSNIDEAVQWNYGNGFLLNYYNHAANAQTALNVQMYYTALANYSDIWVTDLDNMTDYINNRYNYSISPSYSSGLLSLNITGTNTGYANVTIHDTKLFRNGTTYLKNGLSYLYIYPNNVSTQVNASITPSASSITINITTYNSTSINFTATNTTSNQTFNASIGNDTFPITNGQSYQITKNGVFQQTVTASGGYANFTNIACCSDFEITKNSVNFTFSNIAQTEPQIYQSSQSNRISAQISDSDGSISSVLVGITYLGYESNYSMTNSSGTWIYDFRSGVPGTYTVSGLYATDNASGTNSTTTGLSFVVVPLQQGGNGGSSGGSPNVTVSPTPTVTGTPKPTATQSPLIPVKIPDKVTIPQMNPKVTSFVNAMGVQLSGLNTAISTVIASNPVSTSISNQISTTSQWIDSYIATIFRSDNFFAGSTVEDFMNKLTPNQWQIAGVIAIFLLLLMIEKRNK